MTALDDIAKERQRISERLTQLDAERVKLAEELAELETTERVLGRLNRRGSTRRGREPTAEAPAPTKPLRRRQRKEQPVAAPALSLGDAALRAISALGNGASAEEVRNYLGQELGMQVRANHLGRALQRHLLAGRLEQRESRWWSVEPSDAMAPDTSGTVPSNGPG